MTKEHASRNATRGIATRSLLNQRSNQDPDHYTKFSRAVVEVVQALSSGAGGGSCSVGGNAQALAQELAAAAATGQLRVLEPRYLRQIEGVAAGKPTPNCGIDVGTLQIMVLAVRSFETVGVSDINRKCTGSQLGAGTGSSHWTLLSFR